MNKTDKDTSIVMNQVKDSKFFIVQSKIGYDWQNKNVFRSYQMAKDYASFYEGNEIRIDCFTPSIGIHIYVNIR